MITKRPKRRIKKRNNRRSGSHESKSKILVAQIRLKKSGLVKEILKD